MNEKTPRENTGRMAGLLREQLADLVAAAYELSNILGENEKGKQYLSVLNRCLCRQLRMVRRLELEHKLTSEDEVRLTLVPVDLTLACGELVEEVSSLLQVGILASLNNLLQLSCSNCQADFLSLGLECLIANISLPDFLFNLIQALL